MQSAVLFKTGRSRLPPGLLGGAIKAFAVIIAIWVVYNVVVAVSDIFAMTVVFLPAMLVLVFITITPLSESINEWPTLFDWALSLIAAASGVYFWINSNAIINRITLFDPLSPAELWFGIAIVLLTLEATRRAVGLGLSLIVLGFIIYNLVGHIIPGELGHGYIPISHFIDVTVYTTDALYGVPVRVAATYAFMFVLFGTMLARAGGADFFYRAGALLAGRSIGGTAKIAVISSGAYGMISGSPVSDVITTGSVTIPTMERAGYPKDTASAIEVAASTGGSIMPPVMGSVAFIMAEYTGIPYSDIAISALTPALLYYFGVFVQVHYLSKRLGMRGLSDPEIPGVREAIRHGELFLVPLGAIVIGLVLGYSGTFVATFGAVTVFAVALLRKSTRISLKGAYDVLAETSFKIIGVTAACAAAGLVIGGLSMTGLAIKFSSLVLNASGEWLFISLVLTAAITIILGMGMPTPSVYILATVLVGPVLQKLGLSVLTANMFLLYYSVLSASTPPVAVAAYAAAAISGGHPIRIGAIAVKLSIAAAIVPFCFAYSPELLLVGSAVNIAIGIVTAVLGVYLVAVAIEGHLNKPLPIQARLLLGASGICFIAPSIILGALGVVLAAAGLALTILDKTKRVG